MATGEAASTTSLMGSIPVTAARPLPGKLPAAITIASGKIILTVDSAGALFISQNGGKRWKAVKPHWHGKVVDLTRLAEPALTSTAAFQVITDSGSAWMSRDGSHWYPAPAQH
jgi:photosystem II stability/assembly factor-like uncharacterized protein